MLPIEQGDILSVENIRHDVLIVSKDFFNRTEMAIVCPITDSASPDPLHIRICTDETEGIVLCEQLKLLDLKIRGFKKKGHIKYSDIMNITDAVQSIFDY